MLLTVSLIIQCKSDSGNEQKVQETANQGELRQMTNQPNTESVRSADAFTEVPKVSVKEAKRLAEKEGYTFVDLRTPAETADGKIGNAIEMNIRSYDYLNVIKDMPPDEKLIIYCNSGNRSALAAKLFSELQFTNVVEMSEGYEGWTKKYGK